MATDGARKRARQWLLECAKTMGGPRAPKPQRVVILPEVQESLAKLLDAERDLDCTCPEGGPDGVHGGGVACQVHETAT